MSASLSQSCQTPPLSEVVGSPRVIAEGANFVFVVLACVCFLCSTALAWVGKNAVPFEILFCVFAAFACATFWMVLWRNVSLVLLYQLACEVNVMMVVMLVVLNLALDCWNMHSDYAPVFSCMLLIIVLSCVFLDAVQATTHRFSVYIRVTIVLLISFNLVGNYAAKPCSDLDDDPLWELSHHTITWFEAKRLLFMQLVLLLTASAFLGSRDQSQKFVNFPIAMVVKRHECVRRPLTFSTFFCTSNHLAEFLVVVVGTLSFALYTAKVYMGAVILVFAPIVVTCVFILVGNVDVNVLRLVFSQQLVIVILIALVANIVWTLWFNPSPYTILGSFAYFSLVTLFISFDAVRVISRWFRVYACLIIMALIFCDLAVDFSINPCDTTDSLFRRSNGIISSIQIERTIGVVILFAHVRPWYLLLFRSHPQMLYFVTAKMRKQFLLEGRGARDRFYVSVRSSQSPSLDFSDDSKLAEPVAVDDAGTSSFSSVHPDSRLSASQGITSPLLPGA